jgi:putative ABC transport system permease protein
MLKIIITTSFRFLRKNSAYTLINVLGLALGLATSLLIFLYVSDELSYDKFHKDYENIYRVQEKYDWEDYKQFWATCDGSMKTRIVNSSYDGIAATRVMSYFNPPFLYANARSTDANETIFADSSFFDVFSFPLKEKLEGRLLNQANQIMLSENIVLDLFGNQSALGKTIEADGEQFVISAVFEEIPKQSHIHFDVVFSMELLRKSFPTIDSTGPMVFYTYVKTSNKQAKAELHQYLRDLQTTEIEAAKKESEKRKKELEKLNADIVFVPLKDIHLKSHAEKEYQTNGNYEYIIIYLTIAIFILILASINYINLATASSVVRAREIGMRKVLGAQQRSIFLHFISEAFLLVLISTITALVLVELIFPTFNAFVGKDLSINMIWNFEIVAVVIGAVFLISLLSGLYPSLLMSQFHPLKVLANRLNAQKNNKLNLILRRFLVISQFSIAVFLSVASFTVAQQLGYIQNQDVGFDREKVLVIPFNGEIGLNRLNDLKEDFLKTNGTVSVTGSSNVPGERFGYYGIYMPSAALNDSAVKKEDQKNWLGVRMLCADHDFLSSFGFEIVEGRTFSRDIVSDSNAFILNEAAVRKYNIKDPIGKKVIFNYAVKIPKKGRIIGVVKDFHYASFHSEVDPLMIQIFPPFYRYIIVKFDRVNAANLVSEIERKWHKHMPRTPFEYYFLDESYEAMYTSDNRLGRIFYFFTFIALFLAALGLYGLVAFISEQRKAEIGIRKVLGASVQRLMFTMSKEFVLLILLSNVLAWIPAWFFINTWLDDFVFRIDLNLWPFIVTALVSVFIGLFTISIKTYAATKENPSEVLKAN